VAGITRAIARAAAAAKKVIPRRLGLSKPEADDPIPSDDRLQKLAYHYHQAYQKKHNLDRSYHGQDLPYVSDDDALRQRIADHYESVKHDPKDPHVARAFHQYKKEIRDQYNFLTKHGFHFDEAKPGENTASPSAEQVVAHIRKNRHLSIFGGGQPPSDHPLAEPFPDRPGWSYNHAFRAVHDVFGHAVEGNDFSNRGETNASFAHAKMFSPLARKAMLGDTLGQNAAYSHGKNSHLPENDPKRFPAQKAYLFPEDLVPGALRSGGPRPVSPHPHRIGKLLFGKSAEAALVFKSADEVARITEAGIKQFGASRASDVWKAHARGTAPGALPTEWHGWLSPDGRMFGNGAQRPRHPGDPPDQMHHNALMREAAGARYGDPAGAADAALRMGFTRVQSTVRDPESVLSVEHYAPPTLAQVRTVSDLAEGHADFQADHGAGAQTYFRSFPDWKRAFGAPAVLKSQVRGYTRTRGGKTVMVRAYERRAPIFTSYGAEVAASRLPNRAQPQQVLGTLRGAGVREEEIQASGLHGMLASANKPVERGAVVRRLESGQPKMNEVLYHSPPENEPRNPHVTPMQRANGALVEAARKVYPEEAWEDVTNLPVDLVIGVQKVANLPESLRGVAQAYLDAQQKFSAFEERQKRLAGAGKPQYATYTLPGGKDYHELLLTLPPEPSHEKELEAKRTRFQRRMARKYGANADLMFDTSQFGSERNINEWRSLRAAMTPEERAKESALAEAALTARHGGSTNDYTSAHWPDVNVLAHVRFKEHPSTDGKRVLLVEEVQSDWHQAGRQQGYRDPDSTARLEQMRKQWGEHREAYVRAQAEFKRLSETLAPQLRAIREETDKRDRYTVTDAETGKVLYDGPDAREARILAHGNPLARYEEHLDDYGPEYAALQSKIGAKGKEYQEHVEAARLLAAEIQQAEDRASSAIPDAPFKKTWHELVMKRMLRWAAEHGFDKLAWTTGKQQNDRYNLTAVGKTLELRAGEHGTPYELLVHPHTAGTGPRTFPLESLDKLDDYVGHAVANTMRDALAEREAAGLDFVQMPTNGLEVGGQGMRGFYDKILPEFMGKYTKRWGGKVGSTAIDTGVTVIKDSGERERRPWPNQKTMLETVHSVDITPELREHVMRHGQYLFKAERPALVFKAQVKGYTRTRGGKTEFVRPHMDRRLAREGAHQAAKMHVEGLVRDFLATPEGDYWREALHDPERAVGRCDTIARSLYDYLHKRGVPARMVSATGLLPGLAEGAASDWIEFVGDDPKQARNLGHVFVVTRHAAIDISASQFGKPFAGIRVLPLDRYLDDWQHARTMEPFSDYNPDRLYMPIRLKSVAGDGMHLVFKASDHWRDEPRHPAGVPEGGQWRGNGNGGFSADIEAEPASAAFELTHGEGSPYAAKYPNLYNLCFRTNYAVTRAVMDHVTQVALEESGAEAVEAIYGPGGYQTYPVVPSGILKVREDSHKVGVLADIIGYLAQQTAVYVHDPDRNGDHQGIQIVQNNGDDLSHPKALQAFWNRLNELAPEIAQGFSPTRHQGRYGIRIINSDAPWTEEQVAKFTGVVNQLDEEFGYDLEAGRFRCFFENHENNWKEHPDGKAYLDSLAAAGRPDLQRRLQRVYGPATERWIEDALRTHAPRTYRAWAKGRHVGEGEAESLGLAKSAAKDIAESDAYTGWIRPDGTPFGEHATDAEVTHADLARRELKRLGEKVPEHAYTELHRRGYTRFYKQWGRVGVEHQGKPTPAQLRVIGALAGRHHGKLDWDLGTGAVGSTHGSVSGKDYAGFQAATKRLGLTKSGLFVVKAAHDVAGEARLPVGAHGGGEWTRVTTEQIGDAVRKVLDKWSVKDALASVHAPEEGDSWDPGTPYVGFIAPSGWLSGTAWGGAYYHSRSAEEALEALADKFGLDEYESGDFTVWKDEAATSFMVKHGFIRLHINEKETNVETGVKPSPAQINTIRSIVARTPQNTFRWDHTEGAFRRAGLKSNEGLDSFIKFHGYEGVDAASMAKAVAPEPVGSLVEVGRRFPRRAHQMHTASGKVVWVEEQWVSARGHREPQQALPAAPEQLALPRARFRAETPLAMPHPERAEPIKADEEKRVARQKAELAALADERRASPYSPLDFAERITDVERGGPTETVERTAQWIDRAALDQYGQSPFVGAKKYVSDPKTGKKKLQRVSNQEIAEYVSPKMVDDILWQLEQEHNGSNWYKKDLKYVREQLPKIYPEMKDNPSLQKLFWMLLPPTSYGANPKTNFSAAHNVYRYFTRTGVLSPYQPFSKMVAGKEVEGQKGWTSRAKPVAANITALNRLRERFKSESDPEGLDGAFHWLELKHPVEELMEIRGGKELNPATETYPRKGKSPLAYGAMIFGPKGGSFFLNLTGNMEPLTADMWFTRSWGRYMGRVTEVASDVGTKNARAGHATIPRSEWPKVVTERPLGDPAASQRPAMREAIKIVSREVSKAMGRKVTTAECQAALWYYEQNLWAVMGADTLGYSYMDGVEYARLRKVMDDDAEKRGESLDGLSSDDKLFQQYSKRNFPEALRRARAARYSPSPTARREDAFARHFNAGAEGGAKGSSREPVAKFAFLTRKNPRGESVFQKRITFKRDGVGVPTLMAQVKPYTGRRHGKMVFIAGYSRQGRAHREAAPAERMGGGERIVDLMDSPDAKAAMADFGFRHVYWGEYARSEEGAQVIGKVMDAFRALATMIDLPPAGITLNHRLGLYFTGLPGLDWSGRYDPSQVEIQIEKGTGGASTLAHEWGHFLDHMLDQVGRAKDPDDFQSYTSGIVDQIRKNRKNPHLPDHVRKQQLTPIQAAVARVLDIARTAKYENNLGVADTMIGWAKKYASTLADKRAPSSYWTKPTEVFARAFEAYVDWKEQRKLSEAKGGFDGLDISGTFFDAAHHRSIIFPRGEAMADFVEAFDSLFRLLKEDHFFEKALSMLTLKAMPPVHKMTRAAYGDWLEEHELPKKPPRRRGVDPVKWRANIQEAIDHARGKRATISPDNVLAYDKMAAASRNDAAAKGKQAKASASEARMRKTGNLEFDRHGRVYYGPEHPDTINTGFRPAIASIQHPGKQARYAVGTEEAMRRHFSAASRAVKSGKAAGTLGMAPHRLTTYASQDKAQEHYKRLVAAVPTAREARERQMAETVTPEARSLYRKAMPDFEPPDDGPNAAEVKWWVAGKNKLHYPAFYNPLTNILRIVEREADEDDEDPDEIDKPNLALPERALAKSFGRPSAATRGDTGYHYHATAEEYLPDIAQHGLKTHKPWHGTDQDSWPDGSTEARNYFTTHADAAHQFAPEAGPSALLRVHESKHPFKREAYTGDTYSSKTIPSKHIEVMGEDGSWRPIHEHFPQQKPSRSDGQLSLPFGKALANPSSRLLWFPARADMILAGLCPDVELLPGALEKALLEKAVGGATPPKTTTRKLTSPGMGSKGEPKQPKGKGYFSGSEISEMNLKWITVHPNGPGSEGQPILVHDNGQHYVVVGGAGGAMNQLTLKKDASHYQEVKKQKSEGKAKRQAQADQMAKEQPEEFQRLQNMRAAAVSKASEHMEALRQMTDKILQQNRADTDAKVRQQAEAHAKQLSSQLGSDKGIDPETLKAEREKAEALPAKAKAKRLDQLNRAEQGLTAFSDDDIKEFGNQAVAQAHKEEENAQRQILNAACFQLADAIQNGRDPTQGHVTVQVAGKTVNAKFSGSDMMEAARQMAGIAEKRAAEKAIIRALNTGRYDILGGMTQGFLDHTPSDTEVKKWVEDRQLNRASVKANVRLVTESEQASASRQRRSQAQGAADTLNGLVNDSVGTSVTTPETAHILGPEDTARVAAAYMRKGGVNTNAKAKEMDARIAQTNYASVVSALSTASDLRSIGKKAMQSASDTLTVAGGPGGQFKTSADVEGAAKELGLSKGEYDTIRSPDGFQMRVSGKPAIDKVKGAGYEGSDEPADVTFAQAGVVARTMGAERLRRLNVARGEMRAAAALSSFLHYDPDQPMAVHGGETIVEATLRARQLGLKAGQYRTSKRAGGGIDILVDPENVHLLAQPAQIKEAQRGVEKHDLVEEVRDRIRELGPAAYVNPDLQDGTETDAQGKQIGSVALLPHQILGVKAIMRFKHEILNHGAGSGKTATYLAAMSEMMREDPSVRGVLTMPAKPKGQQAERLVEEWEPAAGPNGEGGWVKSRKTGEIRKFLKSSVGQRIVVVKSGAHLQKAIEQVKAGKANFLVMSPELMRDYSNQLVKEGFADPQHGAFIGDEAHEYATGVGDAASDKARAARKFAGANHVVLGSGTLIEKNGSDLHSLVDFVAPGALGGKRKFMEQWERLAQQRASGGSGFAVEKMAAMKRMLSPYMTSYHQAPTREGGGAGEFVREDPEIRVVETPPEVRKQIIAINEDFKQAMASGNEGQRREAALRRDGRVNRALLGAHVAEAVKADLTAALAKPTKAGNGTLPARALIWSQEIGPNSPLAKVRKALGPEVMKHIVQITGDDNEKQAQTSARRLNDMTNDVVGCLMSNAANYGLNLQGASHIFMLGLPSTQQRQIIARALRLGQRRDKVKAVNYISDHLFHQLQARRTLKERAASVDLLSELQDKPMGMGKSLVDERGMWSGEKRFWIKPNGDSIEIPKEHEDWLRAHREDPQVKDAFPTKKTHFDNYDVEDFARKTGWSRSRHWASDGKMEHSYSLPNTSRKTFDAVQVHHSLMSPNEPGYATLQVEKKEGLGGAIHYHDVPAGEDDWKSSFDRARVAGMTKAVAAAEPDEGNGASEADDTDDTDASAGQDQGQDAVTVSGGDQRTGMQQQALQETVQALLGDESGAGEVLAQHWGTIVKAAGSVSPDLESGGGPAGFGDDERTEQFGKSEWQPARTYRRYRPAAAAGAGAGRPAHSALIFRVAAAR
jgi:hypothetical protein